MCKRDRLSLLEDQIREEYSEFSCLEMFDEIDRLNKEVETDENQLRITVLAEMTKNSEMDEDRMFD